MSINIKTIDAHKTNFHQDLDVRGMRGDEALNALLRFSPMPVPSM